MTATNCPLCGTEVSKRGLSGHRNSYRCKALQGLREAEERGLTLVSRSPNDKQLNWIRDQYGDDAIVRLACDYRTGSRNSRGSVNYGYFVEPDLLEEAKHHVKSTSRMNRLAIQYKTEQYCFAVSESDYRDRWVLVEYDDGDGLTRKRKLMISKQSCCDDWHAYDVTHGEYFGDVLCSSEDDEMIDVPDDADEEFKNDVYAYIMKDWASE